MPLNKMRIVLKEIEQILCQVDNAEAKNLVKEIIKAKNKTIVCAGAGRVGNAIWAFSMRLGHLGFKVHCVGDSTTPAVGKNDLLIVASGSGETETIYHLVRVASGLGTRIALVTGNKDSRMGKLANTVTVIPAPSKTQTIPGFKSIQPMTTLNEQCLNIFFDVMVLELMQKLKKTEKHMWDNHSKLE